MTRAARSARSGRAQKHKARQRMQVAKPNNKKLEEASAELESRFIVALVGNNYQAATGEPYVVIVSGGVKEEGCPVVCWCSSEDHAIRLWRDAINEYAKEKSGVLYWRTPPQLDRRKIARDYFYVVYSRLLISDKPQIQPQLLPPEPPTRAQKIRL